MDWNPDARMAHRHQPVVQDLEDHHRHRTLTAFLQHIILPTVLINQLKEYFTIHQNAGVRI